ncbi:hypothetical protein SAMN05216167_110101 [Spirosoma endophyticum]|uniref:Uncharacterized protein n=1 Tax=Spirosoma endophyticum TaxID=662367 RepID=A0A1I1XSL4_9BACT|nr:hypothetical protein SAMN05216167_110101 [Spirosoma endophyticum]
MFKNKTRKPVENNGLVQYSNTNIVDNLIYTKFELWELSNGTHGKQPLPI